MDIQTLKTKEVEKIITENKIAQKSFIEQKEARDARKKEAFMIHVTCMDERDRFAPTVTGEPCGSIELYASPGGCFTQDRDPLRGAQELINIYEKDIKQAQEENKEVIIYLMPHTSYADNKAGCAAFKSDEDAEIKYFSDLADELKKIPLTQSATIYTVMYDTDDHHLVSFHDSKLPPKYENVLEKVRETAGISDEGKKDDLDRFHGGYRVYIGQLYHAWNPRRNVSYFLHDKMDKEELLEGIALALNIIKTHSHANLEEVPMTIQIDRLIGEEDKLKMTNEELINRLNESPLIKDAGLNITAEELLIVRSETNPETWEGVLLD